MGISAKVPLSLLYGYQMVGENGANWQYMTSDPYILTGATLEQQAGRVI